jgi:hypothetical protein
MGGIPDLLLKRVRACGVSDWRPTYAHGVSERAGTT